MRRLDLSDNPALLSTETAAVAIFGMLVHPSRILKGLRWLSLAGTGLRGGGDDGGALQALAAALRSTAARARDACGPEGARGERWHMYVRVRV